MKHKILVLLFIMTLALSIHAFDYVEYYFKIPYTSKTTINEINKLCSVDKFDAEFVYAYANPKQFIRVSQEYEALELLTNPSKTIDIPTASSIDEMREWDSYPNYSTYIAMMEQFAIDYPNLCSVESIGTSVDNREILVAKISDNVTVDEAEPKLFYTGQMHGDEIVCYVLFLRLIDYLLVNYETDPEIAEIVNNTQIYINPLSNPDGLYTNNDNTINGATRYNANGVDLNRNYPTPTGVDHPDNESWQPETIIMMNYADQHNFVFSSNTHSGAEVVNYPWDTWQRRHPDNNWFHYISRMYADTVHENAPNSYMTDFENGITNGYDWYSVLGGRQDWFTYYKQTREITLELSLQKILPTSQLNNHWNYNYQSMIEWIRQVNYGIQGVVTDALGEPLVAKIEILDHDSEQDKSYVFSSELHGDYYRPLFAGVYDLKVSCEGYETQIIEDVAVENDASLEVNVTLASTTLTSFSGFVYTDEATPLSGVEVTLTDFTVFAATTDETGYFMIDNIFTGNYNLRVYKEGFEPYTGFIDISEEGNTMDFNLNISYAESFESLLPDEWYSTTSRSWFRDGNNAYDGSYSLKSGNISGNQTSNILVESNVATESIISFYYKVSSEAGYDLFKFYINGQLKGSWSGEVDWTYVEYTTNPGLNTYKWEYNKDIYTSDGSDAAWIDYVSLPQTITNNSDLDLVTAVDHQLSCYPNPFNPELNISFYQSAQNPISEISIYNLKGQKVKHFANILTSEGHQTVVWDGRDINKKSVASGIYFIKTKSEDMTTTHKVILMK